MNYEAEKKKAWSAGKRYPLRAASVAGDLDGSKRVFPISDRFYLRAGHLAGPDPVPWDLALPNHAGMGLAVCDRKHGLEMDVPFRLRYSQ